MMKPITFYNTYSFPFYAIGHRNSLVDRLSYGDIKHRISGVLVL